MTTITVLATPARWPRLLLPDAAPSKPADLDAAIKDGAWVSFTKVIEEMGVAATIATVARSGLRGRGGSGFPTGEKWRACALTEADRRYVVVNAYQSDPAVMSDRVLLETNPYAVLEGAAIAAYAVGAAEIIVAVRAEATDAIRVMEAAIAASEQRGFLGLEILGRSLEITATVKPLQGSYMLGEETVLLKGIEGKRGQPDQQPPYPTTRGLFGLPTLIHHPQTFAAIPTIVGRGPGGYAAALEAARRGVSKRRRGLGAVGESFDRVVHTKADSAFVLSRKLRPESLQCLMFMSSVTAAFGNRGQADYAAANAFLDCFTSWANQKLTYPVISVNWDSWRDAGMHHDWLQTLPEARRGRERPGAIGEADGKSAFLRLLASPPTQAAFCALDLDQHAPPSCYAAGQSEAPTGGTTAGSNGAGLHAVPG